MFFLRREGEFECQLTGKFHCGILPTNTFRYEAEICVADPGLDSSGFVMDNAYIQQYFDGIRSTNMSCELLACNTARHFAKLLDKNSALSVKVKIWGIPTAHVEYVWVKGEPTNKVTLSAIRRKATER